MNDWILPGAERDHNGRMVARPGTTVLSQTVADSSTGNPPAGGKCGLERVTGPWEGIYVAAYTTELDGHFYGYAKLCTSRPSDMWSVHVMLKITARRGYFFETDALEAVENLALRVIAKMRPPSFWSALFSLG